LLRKAGRESRRLTSAQRTYTGAKLETADTAKGSLRSFAPVLDPSGALVAPFAAEAQQPGKVVRVGYLHPGNPRVEDVNRPTAAFNVLRQSLWELGWIEGQNVIFEPRYAGDEANKLPAFATELVRIPVDVLLTVATAATQTAKNATKTIPSVMYPVGDPVAAGFVATLARPVETSPVWRSTTSTSRPNAFRC